MDEIEKRLRETSENSFNCYEAWLKDKKSVEAKEALVESIHELRRVASRLEIEVAVSERDESVKKPLPIPQNRSSKPRRGNNDGNTPKGNKGGKKKPSKPKDDDAGNKVAEA